jgi:hypothetical protein
MRLIRHIQTAAAPRGSGRNAHGQKQFSQNLPKLITGWTFLWKPFMASSQIGGGGAAGTEFFQTSDTRMTQLERHDWKRQPMFEVHMPIAIPQNLWQDVGQNAAAIVLQSETNEWTRLK